MSIETTIALQVEHLETLDGARRAALLERGRSHLGELRAAVTRILEDVRERGDTALLFYAAQFDAAPKSLRVPREEIDGALAMANPAYVTALRQSAANIERFHRAQRRTEPPIETAPGVRIQRVWRPLSRVGVYVPGGGARYPSCLLMAAIPARVAGCAEVAVCTPPDRDGRVPAPVLAAAAIAGVTEVYAAGGVQAIAALAYGTATIRRVDKIVGPGSSYVAAAKALVASEVATDLPAGPSEILIVADETAPPEWVAADLLAQAEHGPESACVLVTTSAALAGAVRAALARRIETLPTAPVIRASLARNGALLVAESLAGALAFANDYAAEHLELMLVDADRAVERIAHAGSVFLGSWSAVAAGDYASGGNHTLPTAGYARGFGPLAVETFGRWMQVQRLSAAGLDGLRETITTLAGVEGLPAHADSITARFEPPSSQSPVAAESGMKEGTGDA